MERGQRAQLIRKTRNDLGLSQVELASCLRVPVNMLRDWEQARAMAPDFAVAYIRVIAVLVFIPCLSDMKRGCVWLAWGGEAKVRYLRLNVK